MIAHKVVGAVSGVMIALAALNPVTEIGRHTAAYYEGLVSPVSSDFKIDWIGKTSSGKIIGRVYAKKRRSCAPIHVYAYGVMGDNDIITPPIPFKRINRGQRAVDFPPGKLDLGTWEFDVSKLERMPEYIFIDTLHECGSSETHNLVRTRHENIPVPTTYAATKDRK